MDGVVVSSELYSAESGKTVDGRLCVRLLDQVLISAIFLVMWLSHVAACVLGEQQQQIRLMLVLWIIDNCQGAWH